MKNRVIGNSGMITVEAAAIVPLIFIIIIGMMYLGFYLLDGAKIYSTIDQVAAYAGQSVGRSEDMGIGEYSMKQRNRKDLYKLTYQKEGQKVEEQLKKELKDSLFLLDIKNIQAAVGKGCIKINVGLNGSAEVWRSLGLNEAQLIYENRTELGDYSQHIRKIAAKRDADEEK